MDHAAYALQAAWVRFQQQLPCSWFCVNELQSAAKIMLRGPKKLKWGLLSTWLTFPVSLIKTHPTWFLRDFNWVWSAPRDSLFPFIIKMNLLKTVGRIHCTSAGSLRVWGLYEYYMRSIWWQSPSISKSPLRLISTYLICSLYGS